VVGLGWSGCLEWVCVWVWVWLAALLWICVVVVHGIGRAHACICCVGVLGKPREEHVLG